MRDGSPSASREETVVKRERLRSSNLGRKSGTTSSLSRCLARKTLPDAASVLDCLQGQSTYQLLKDNCKDYTKKKVSWLLSKNVPKRVYICKLEKNT